MMGPMLLAFNIGEAETFWNELRSDFNCLPPITAYFNGSLHVLIAVNACAMPICISYIYGRLKFLTYILIYQHDPPPKKKKNK